ncbi:MAG: Histidinol-phosphate aminotransferase 2 [Gammaproteobacteria bacterium]|nr:Histidinol-phosphate aminotransferase 2 [Gammaproteobacteria bacterium]
MNRGLVERWVSAPVRRLEAYHVADAGGLVKLDAMENPYTWPAPLVGEWFERLRHVSINRYPSPGAEELKRGLRRYAGMAEEAPVLLGNGSDELIQIVAMAVSGPGRTILAPEPTFVMYRMVAEVLGFRFVGVPLRAEDFSIDADAVCGAIAEHQPAVVFLACPNNPTGNLFDRPAVERILAAAPGLVVIDEAYYPFAGETWLHDLYRHENMVVMQTLSKAGLAGLRVGMLFGPAEWLEEFDKVRLPYNINVLSQASVSFILEHADLLREQTAQIRADREALYQRLRELPGTEAWPSRANFLLFRTARRARSVFDGLREQGVLIKLLDGAHPLLRECLRVTVGTPGENDRFISALRRVLDTL